MKIEILKRNKKIKELMFVCSECKTRLQFDKMVLINRKPQKRFCMSCAVAVFSLASVLRWIEKHEKNKQMNFNYEQINQLHRRFDTTNLNDDIKESGICQFEKYIHEVNQ